MASVLDPLDAALQDFQESLSPSQKTELSLMRGRPDAHSVLKFTAEVDARNTSRKGRCVASRIFGVLESIQQFASILDIFVQANPGIAALVWGSVKFTFLAVSNFTSYWNLTSEWFMALRNDCPRLSEYQLLFRDSPRLQAALCKFYATVVRCCKYIILASQRSVIETAARSLFQPLTSEFMSFEKDLRFQNQEVNKEIRLAAEKAADDERRLQSAYRARVHCFQQLVLKDGADSRGWRQQAEERRLIKRRTFLLEKLSDYDHLFPLRQARKKRHGTTSLWLNSTDEYETWLRDAKSSVFWLSGILGSGKTVLTAAVIDSIFRTRSAHDGIAFFFCRYNDEASLTSRTILGSLIRQLLRSGLQPVGIESKLAGILENDPLDSEDLESLLIEALASFKSQFILLDGVDECPMEEQRKLLNILCRAFCASSSRLKLFIAARDSVGSDLRSRFPELYCNSMRHQEVQKDIKTYVEDMVEEKQRNRDLKVGNQMLVLDICNTLVREAQGMFLWASFQINDLCEEDTDEGIRERLQNLPRDLNETYERILSRIIKRQKCTIAKKVFQWVAAVKRPLTLEELREAIAIEPCQEYMRPERLMNDINSVITICGNLVVLDEELYTVEFAHHSIRQFLLSSSYSPSLRDFHFSVQRIDHGIGEACVTYLNLNDFKRQLTRRGTPRRIEPLEILSASLTSISDSEFPKYASRVVKLWNHQPRKSSVTINHLMIGSTTFAPILEPKYALLGYARKFWLHHTTTFSESSVTWSLWKAMMINSESWVELPWTVREWLDHSRVVTQWILDNDHCALLQLWYEILVTESGFKNGFTQPDNYELDYLIQEISTKPGSLLLHSFTKRVHSISGIHARSYQLRSTMLMGALQIAAAAGVLENVKVIWEAIVGSGPVDSGRVVNVKHKLFKALQCAVDHEHSEVVSFFCQTGLYTNNELEMIRWRGTRTHLPNCTCWYCGDLDWSLLRRGNWI